MCQFLGVSLLVSFRYFAHATHRNAEVSRVRHQLDGGVKERDKAHALRSEYQGYKLVTHKANQDVEALNAPKQACILQNM